MAKRGPYKVRPRPCVALSPRAAAEAIGVHITKLKSMIELGLPTYKNGTHVRILVADLENFVREHWDRRS